MAEAKVFLVQMRFTLGPSFWPLQTNFPLKNILKPNNILAMVPEQPAEITIRLREIDIFEN